MNRYTWTENGRTYTRINRTKAKAAYNSGKPVIACPCNLRPGWPWHPEATLDRNTCGLDFDVIENTFRFYNIRNAETGKYISWYIEKEDGTK